MCACSVTLGLRPSASFPWEEMRLPIVFVTVGKLPFGILLRRSGMIFRSPTELTFRTAVLLFTPLHENSGKFLIRPEARFHFHDKQLLPSHRVLGWVDI